MNSPIQQYRPVMCADGHTHGQLDRIGGDNLKRTKDERGPHHWRP
ncbi:DUF2171 domain-containing protein [Deinococcus radiotolerans]|uniref:Uncharacterized protein n=1 Tax=Deinococcus radiotolerans TaxID=1309407 RepID=A0ABQ2FPJ1_9DEIO|nr:DUF2171 domain-containing protein [Deinococcus radiotolerans]GGL14301.1 hypothetical protein GCM10010844_36340 [Deinococcus radiotolerans]